jgi:hypothetical protein
VSIDNPQIGPEYAQFSLARREGRFQLFAQFGNLLDKARQLLLELGQLRLGLASIRKRPPRCERNRRQLGACGFWHKHPW